MTKSGITLKQNGNITFGGCIIIGKWFKRDIWAELHAIKGRDRSGNKLVHFTYGCELLNGYTSNFNYTKEELREAISRGFSTVDLIEALKANNK